MKLKWLGAAGFQIEAGDKMLLIDPYLSRNPKAKPVQTLQSQDISGANQIFVTHGHFDHIYDIPAISALGSPIIYCSAIVANTLARKGVDKSRLNIVGEDGLKIDFGAYRAQAFFSRHVKFDIPLVAKGLLRVGTSYNRLSTIHKGYPEGQVLSWRFTINGFVVHHFGSSGSTPEELQFLAANPIDLLLIPLQGHSHICDISFEYVRILKPRMVIPHHYDNFYPPISTAVDIGPFVKKVKEKFTGTEVIVSDINETISL